MYLVAGEKSCCRKGVERLQEDYPSGGISCLQGGVLLQEGYHTAGESCVCPMDLQKAFARVIGKVIELAILNCGSPEV